MMSKADILLRELFRASVSSVQPEKLVHRIMKVNECHLTVKDKTFEIKKPVSVVGFGKAVAGMAIAVEEALGPLLQRGIVSIPAGFSNKNKNYDLRNSKIEFLEGADNNLPDENAMNAASKIKNFVRNLDEKDLVIVLISGGGSALLPLPKYQITLSEKLDLIKKLGNQGANIAEMNCVRKQLSELKGGGLSSICYPATVISLILSDVLGDPLDIIASGPTYPNKDKPEDAIKILKKFCVYDELPNSIRQTLNNNSNCEKNNYEIFRNVNNFIIGNNGVATEAISVKSKEMKLQSFILSTKVNGDVQELVNVYHEIATSLVCFINKKITNDELVEKFVSLESSLVPIEGELIEELRGLDPERSFCLVLAGEPTVKVSGSGIGGRNQQLVLTFSLKLGELEDLDSSWEVWFLSCGTDGIDGPTDAAGAIGFSGLKNKCVTENLRPDVFIENNDCYSFFEKFSGGEYLVKVGHTGTNVMDIHLMLFQKKKRIIKV